MQVVEEPQTNEDDSRYLMENEFANSRQAIPDTVWTLPLARPTVWINDCGGFRS